LKRLQLIQILCINAEGPAAQPFAMAKACRVNPSRVREKRQKAASANADTASESKKERNRGLLRFTAR
jgi:hypothetical protein